MVGAAGHPGVDLDIPAGQRVLLVGPSGSGKSTLLRGAGRGAGGRGLGRAVRGGPARWSRAGRARGAVGLVLQEPGAGVVSATIGRDVAFGLENIGMPRADMPARVAAALAAVRLEMPQDTPTHALSGGEQQRLALAGALALGPSLLLLDEPTAMLDPGSAASVRASVAEVADARHLTTVVVEHRLGPWLDFADRLVVLDDGRCGRGRRGAARGPPSTVRRWRRRGSGFPAPRPAAPRHTRRDLDPSPIGANVVALSAEGVTVQRSVRRLDGSTRSTRRSGTRRWRRGPGRSTPWWGRAAPASPRSCSRWPACWTTRGPSPHTPTSPAPRGRERLARPAPTGAPRSSPARWPGCRSGRARPWSRRPSRRGDDDVPRARPGRVGGARQGPRAA